MKKIVHLIIVLTFLFGSNLIAQIKVHNNGQISFQSLSSTDGVQIDIAGKTSFEPNLTNSFSRLVETKAKSNYVKAWILNNVTGSQNYSGDMFYVMGSGDVYSGHHYEIAHNQGDRKATPIENATEILSKLTGYYYENHEFDGYSPDYEDNPDIHPEAIDGLMQNLGVTKTLGLSVDELENALPEVIRHDPEGKVFINYSALIPVLIEAVNDQRAEIEQLKKQLGLQY